MIVLRNLTAKSKDEPYTEPPEHHHHVGKDLGNGRIALARLGSSGLTIGDATHRLAIPLDELFALADKHLKQQG